MRLTIKGQVTIPREIRDYLSVSPYDEVEFVVKNGNVLLVKSDRFTGELREHLRKIRGQGLAQINTDDIMKITRGEL